jgi:hypothetical protein
MLRNLQTEGMAVEDGPRLSGSCASLDSVLCRIGKGARASCMRPDRHDWERQTGVFGALSGRVAPLGWGNLGAALLDPFEQGAGVAFDLVVAARNRDG